MKKHFYWVYRWLDQIANPLRSLRGIRGFGWFFADWRAYARMAGSESINLRQTWPQLHDRTPSSSVDAHYYYVNGWAIRRILSQKPNIHIDIASQTIFSNLLSAVLPVIFVDYRPLKYYLQGMSCLAGDILHLPFADDSITSLSCLHVAEHIGLGRYGDPINPLGTKQAAEELVRVIKPGGFLYFALPVGIPRLQFNAHRIHTSQTICEYFSGLELIEFSGVDDSGKYIEHASLDQFNCSSYACGMFLFQKQKEITEE